MQIKKIIFSAFVISTIAISGCKTGYQKDSFTGGYEESWLASDSVRIHYRGNAFTKKSEVADYSLLRIAEIGIERGFPYFAIIDSSSETTTHTTPNSYQVNSFGNTATVSQTGGYSFRKPSADNQALFFKEKPSSSGLIYESKFVCESLKSKHGITDAKC